MQQPPKHDAADGLEHRLLRELINACEYVRVESKRRGDYYNPGDFLQMLHEDGAIKTVKRLLEAPPKGKPDVAQIGLDRLCMLGLLDWSMETIVLKPEYVTLLTEDERERAQRRLDERVWRPR